MSGFILDPTLAADSVAVARLELCEVRLRDDARWPWLVLVPARGGLVELEELSEDERARLIEEVVRAGAAVRMVGSATGLDVRKLNVGALGNVVAQLHVHVIGRRPGDAAGAGPVWGVGRAEPYAPDAREAAIQAARAVFASPVAPSPASPPAVPGSSPPSPAAGPA